MAEHGTLEQVLSPGFLDGVDDWDTEHVRAARATCEEQEAAVSYARRVLQGRLDLLRAELGRRSEGGEDLDVVLGDLPVILSADQAPSNPVLARSLSVGVPTAAEPLEAEIDAIIDRAGLDAVEQRDPEQLAALIDQLAEHEQRLSLVRRQLFDLIDALRAQLVARYRDGRASVTDLLGGR